MIVAVSVALASPARLGSPRWIFDARPAPRPSVPVDSPVPQPTASRLPDPTASLGFDTKPLLLGLVIALVAVVAALLVRRLLRARRPRVTALPAGTIGEGIDDVRVALQPAAPVLRRAFADAIDALHSERRPADAIVAAWLALQDAAAESGVRRAPAETPTEFTARILARVPADGPAITVLLDSYQDVRFGEHAPTSDDLARVRRALGDLQSSWDDPAVRPAGSR